MRKILCLGVLCAVFASAGPRLSHCQNPNSQLWGGRPFKAEKRVFIRFPNGAKIKADVADTPVERERGLMYYKTLPKRYGMLFVFPKPAEMEFWMKNTWVSLDIVYIGADKRVTGVISSVPASAPETPDDKVARVSGAGQYVLELPAGTAKHLGIKKGDSLAFKIGIPER